jgi:DNA-binding transcriptional MerR regulator
VPLAFARVPGVYSIGSAARVLHVPVATLRTWEKRYGTVVPERGPGGHRQYSPQHLEQLRFIAERVRAGLRPGEAYRLLQRGQELELELPGGTEAPARAREAIDAFAARESEETRANLRLLVSELVANAVSHASAADGQPIRLTARIEVDRIRVDVADGGRGFDWRAPPAPEGGRGLQIVSALALRWGLTFDGGTTSWFELARSLTNQTE